MPIEIVNEKDIKPGDLYEDSAYHPCLCIGVEGDEVWGISLIDGSYPRTETLGLSGVRKLSIDEVWRWKTKGPDDLEENIPNKWW